MIKVKLTQDCIYHTSSCVFDYRKGYTKIQEVSNKLGKILLDSGYFEEVKEEAANSDDLVKDCNSCICSKCASFKECSESICKACKLGEKDGTFDQWKGACENFKES